MKFVHYLWAVYSLAIFLIIPAVDFYLLNMSGGQAAHELAFPILVWLVLLTYYLVRWSVRKVRSHPAKESKRAVS